MRHSCAHVMADAVTRLFPSARVTIGPCIDDGFFYDFDFERPFTPEDLRKIEDEMKRIVKSNTPFIRKGISKKEAISFFRERNEPYKIEIIEGLSENEPISLYGHGGFIDLCKGPHVEKTGDIKAFKLLSVAGSYWRGDEKQKQLQRIYGTVFSTEKDLKVYIDRLEEARKRDHRRLGKELDLFTFHAEAPASPFFHPRGALIYRLIVDYLRRLYVEERYLEVITPEILDLDLWQRSGHLDHFRESMFFTEVEEKEMAVKPMNCPAHCLMFHEKRRSYRELPLRLADFGRLHRFERSGVTHGLTRVRSFSQDDAHIYCTPEQTAGEIRSFLKFVRRVYEDFEFNEVEVALATRPDHFIGSASSWDDSEAVLKKALDDEGVKYHLNPGEGAFYGPKIEFQVKDALLRPWQLGTLQVDHAMPERFGLTYVTPAGTTQRPVMLHRAALGSIERFFGILIEHCGGAFPLWLAPVQILLIPITDAQANYASKVANDLKGSGFRVEIDGRNEKLGLKIREAELQKVPYMGVVGVREVSAESVALRHHSRGDLGLISVQDIIKRLSHEVGKMNMRNKTG